MVTAAPHEVTAHRHLHRRFHAHTRKQRRGGRTSGALGEPGAQTPAGQSMPGAPHPIGPSSSRSVRSCVWVLARFRTWRGLTGSGSRPLPQKGQGPPKTAAVRRPELVCPRLGDLLSALRRALIGVLRARSAEKRVPAVLLVAL